MASTDISASVATLQTIATTLTAALEVPGCVTIRSQADEFGQVVLLLGDLANVATAQAPVDPTETELPAVYNGEGQEIVPS